MDVFLRSIGFSGIRTHKQYEDIQNDVIRSPDGRVIFGGDNFVSTAEYYKMYGDNIGIIIRGNIDENENIIVKSCEAYAVSDKNTPANKYVVEYSDNEPVIVFEDIGTGNELVFELQNRIDFYRDEKRFIDYGRSIDYTQADGVKNCSVNFAAFSVHGKILLPVYKDEDSCIEKEQNDMYLKSLVLRFKEGDDEAGEMLSEYAEQTSQTIRERLKEEDFLSIVEGYFMPVEYNDSDYSILGEIVASDTVINRVTNEKIIKLLVNITGTDILLFINKKDLMGMPVKGMRFMGSCRLRGTVSLK